MKVSFTNEQFDLVRHLLNKHYEDINDAWAPINQEALKISYGAIIAMRIALAEKAWKEYRKNHPDPDWSFYSTKEEFFKDQFTIYPSDLK